MKFHPMGVEFFQADRIFSDRFSKYTRIYFMKFHPMEVEFFQAVRIFSDRF